jgi:photosystem II stability/assembly factor-like uncharacterized protein
MDRGLNMVRKTILLLVFAFGCANPSVPLDSSTSGNTTSGPSSGPTTTGDTTVGAGGSGGAGGNVPDGPWVNSTANLAGLDSTCGTLGWLSAKPDEDMLIAGIARQGLWASTDGGTSWNALGTTKVDNIASSIVYDPTNPKRFWETGIYEGHGVFRTDDDGATFVALGDVTHVDLVAVDFTDPARQLLIAGSHERDQTLHHSSDGGMTWTEIGMALPPSRGCTFPFLLDATTALIGCGAPFGGGGVLRSTDGAKTWTEVSPSGAASAPLHATDGTFYWAGPNSQAMVVSTDSGKTWTKTPTSDVGYFKPIELPDGRIAAINSKYVMVSSDHATSWKALVKLPYEDAAGLTYSVQRKAIYVWRAICGTAVKVPEDTIMRYDYATP